jgi:glucokinase
MERAESEFLGIEIGGTKLQIVAGDAHGAIRRRWRAVVDKDEGGAGVQRQIAEGVAAMLPGHAVGAVGVGFGGPIDWRTGTICKSHQINGWENFALRDWLRETVGLPVAVENDSNAAALAEACFGAGAQCDPVFYFNLGSGVGGGLVTGGQIYHGAPPGEVEFGHLRLDRSGATVESRCSGWALDQRIRELRASGAGGPLVTAIGPMPGGEARHLHPALDAGDPHAWRILNELADDLAWALSHVIHLFHPQVIVLGGGLSSIGEPLRAAVSERLPACVMEAFHPPPEVRLAELREDAVPVGAMELARRLAID